MLYIIYSKGKQINVRIIHVVPVEIPFTSNVFNEGSSQHKHYQLQFLNFLIFRILKGCQIVSNEKEILIVNYIRHLNPYRVLIIIMILLAPHVKRVTLL